MSVVCYYHVSGTGYHRQDTGPWGRGAGGEFTITNQGAMAAWLEMINSTRRKLRNILCACHILGMLIEQMKEQRVYRWFCLAHSGICSGRQ